MKEGDLTYSQEGRRSIVDLWYVQVDAAALLMQCLETEGGGRASELERREEEEEAWKGKKRKDPWAYL